LSGDDVDIRKFHSNLGKLGVDINSSEMQVFRAVLVAAGGPDRYVQYRDIASSFESLTGKKYTKAYIYRRLSNLEDSGFIVMDNIHSPRTYAIVETSVTKALEATRKEKLSEDLKKRQELTTMINRLKSVKSQELALMLHKQLSSTSSIAESVMIEGIENVRSTIIQEFADDAKEGDLIRSLGHASTLAEGLGPSGVTELRVLQAGFRGVKVHGLLTPIGQNSPNVNLLANHLIPLFDVFKEVAKTGNIQIRMSPEPLKTYRIVSLNEDKMLLYLTNSKASDVAALIFRKDNPGLVDDAIRTFDRLWKSSIDVFEILKQMMEKKQDS